MIFLLKYFMSAFIPIILSTIFPNDPKRKVILSEIGIFLTAACAGVTVLSLNDDRVVNNL